MSQLWQLGALELAGRIRRGEVTSPTVVDTADRSVADQIEHAVGSVTPIDPVLA